jgi:hypothetical protein
VSGITWLATARRGCDKVPTRPQEGRQRPECRRCQRRACWAETCVVREMQGRRVPCSALAKTGGRCGVFAAYAWTWESMIGLGEAPRGRGCAAASVRRSSAGPAVASATPTCSTVRRSIRLSPGLDCLAISLSIALQDARSSDPLRQCSVRWAPVKAAGPCAPGPHVRPTARVRGAASAAALPSFAGGRGIVNAFCPPRHLESLLRLFGQAAPRRVQLVVPCLSRAIARRL